MNEDNKDPWESLYSAVKHTTTGNLRWTRNLSRMKVDGGWLYRTSTEHYNEGGIVTACSESLCPVMDPKTNRK